MRRFEEYGWVYDEDLMDGFMLRDVESGEMFDVEMVDEFEDVRKLEVGRWFMRYESDRGKYRIFRIIEVKNYEIVSLS